MPTVGYHAPRSFTAGSILVGSCDVNEYMNPVPLSWATDDSVQDVGCAGWLCHPQVFAMRAEAGIVYGDMRASVDSMAETSTYSN